MKALLWRFHFYVGVLVAPLLILTSLSGILYVFAPQIEEVAYAKLLHVAPSPGAAALDYDAQLAAFKAANPKARVRVFTPSFSPERSCAVSFTLGSGKPSGGGGEHEGHEKPKAEEKKEPLTTAYLNPQTGAVLGTLDEESRFKPWIKRAHKTYLGGENGRILTELAASWLMVLLITGFVLWFPKQASKAAGVWVPRLKVASRLRWRDFHSIFGVYALLATLILSFTGLTWSRFSGNYRRSFQKAIGQESAFRIKPPASTLPDDEDAAPVTLVQVAAAAEQAGAARPYKITLPRGKTGSFGVQTYDDPPFQESLTVFVDQYSGQVLSKKGRGITPPVARFFSVGVALHEGRLFGLANQLLCALGAGTIIFSTISGLVMWQKRRPSGTFGAPKAAEGVRLPRWALVGFCVLGVFLPTAAAAFLVIWIFDRFVLPRMVARKDSSENARA